MGRGRGRLCTHCGSYTEQADARQCANPECRTVFSEPQPTSDRCIDCGNRLATIKCGGRWICGQCFDRGRLGEVGIDGPGREIWNKMVQAHRDEIEAARQQRHARSRDKEPNA